MVVDFDETRVRHLLDSVQTERLTRVADIGANPKGRPPYAGLLAMGGCEVWGFEPQAEAYDKLIAAAGPTERYVNSAVGDGSSGTLHITDGDGFTSLLEGNPAAIDFLGHFRKNLDVIDRVELPTRRLDDLELPEFDLLKIDIQGGETQVFDHGRQTLGRCVAVISEVAAIPLYKDQPLLGDQMASLAESGFQLHKFLFFKAVKLRSKATQALDRRFRSQLVDGDAVFVRDLLAFRDHETETLKHLAILADAVFGSFDLAALALEELVRREVVDHAALDAYISLVLGTERGAA